MMIENGIVLLSGPLFLLFFRLYTNFLKSCQTGYPIRDVKQYGAWLTLEGKKLYRVDEIRSLKEYSFLVTCFLCFFFSLLLNHCMDDSSLPSDVCTCPNFTLQIPLEIEVPKREKIQWNRETMVRDGYRYSVDSVPMTLVGKGREFSMEYDDELFFSEVVLIRSTTREGEEVLLKRERIKESLLREILEEIKREEEEDCICPVFLGLRGNLSFIHYREREWIILYDPFISPNPNPYQPAQEEVKRRVHFSKESKFNGFLQAPHRRDLYRQRDRFMVTFDSYSMGQVKRISLPLEGKDAVCFIFCQHQQKEWNYLQEE